LIAACLALVFAQASTAQQRGLIADIQVDGSQRIEPETVRSYMRVKVGDPFDAAKIDQSLKSLFATGLFADVAIRRNGDVLIVDVVENPIINRLAFEGNKRLEDSVLEAEVKLRPRVVYTRSRVQSDVQRLLEVYRANGRFAASIEPKVIQLGQNRVDLVFEISEGPLTGIRRIDFIGNKAFSDSKLRREIATEESRWYAFLSTGDTYDPDRVTLDREMLRKFYLEEGYADFRVISAIAELTQDKRDFFLTFTIEEGERYNFGNIDIKTTLRNLDTEQLRFALSGNTGNTYNATEVEESVRELTFAVGARGFAFVDVRPNVKRNTESKTIDVSYEINEGPRVYVERINIVGNVRTLDKVVRREMELVEGDAFNTAKIRRSRQNIQRLGFFDKVEIARRRGSQQDQLQLDVSVEERSTGELSFGVGYSTTESFIGDVSISERNLLGRGQDLRLSFGLSAERQQIDLKFTEPYFLDRDVSAGFDIFRVELDRQDRSSFDEKNTGFRLRSGFDITRKLRMRVNYGLREDEITDIDSTTSIFIRRDEGSFITSSVGYDLTYDTRDDIFLPTEGVIIRGGQNIAGLGGDVRYLKTTLGWAFYLPITSDLVGSLALKGGQIYGIDQDVRVTDRYFLGGKSFRGFETGGVGPRDAKTRDSIGGNFFYVGTAELRFPLGFPEELGVHGRAFTEFGTLTDPDVSGPGLLDTKDTRVSVGVGLSWTSPFGPIEVDLSQAVVEEDFDQEEFFRFSFGTRF
jgi:outer membrane protein insertion porin family